MPPRIPVPSHLCASALCLRPATQGLNRPSPAVFQANVATLAQRRKHNDPYALAQSRQRKAANMARQEVLRKEREVAMVDPVRGVTTPFLESLDHVGGSAVAPVEVTITNDASKPTQVQSSDDALLNHFLDVSEFEESLNHSYALAAPITPQSMDAMDPTTVQDQKERHEEAHQRAITALSRIVSLANGCQKDRTRANIRRCIDTFGRHNTDTMLKPRAPSIDTLAAKAEGMVQEKTPRAGPDTGSSEVQVAILTAKIRVMTNHLQMKGGNNDKMNKRNLRLLVHRRQKLLNYLRTKERGGERWQNVVNTLGLTEGTWKGEISL